MLRTIWLVFLLLAVLSQPAFAAADIVITFPRPETGPDARARYPLRLLDAALKKSGRPYKIKLFSLPMLQGRALLRLENSEGIDVLSTMTSVEREAKLLPIRIPIDRGMLGWRLLLIRKADAERFSKIRTVDELKTLIAGQGSDWPDSQILRANGFTVNGTANYEALFNMLDKGRFDFFPRGATEIWREIDLYKDQLMVEPNLALRYPSAIYFFVRKADTRLADDIGNGLQKMIADGSFDKIYLEHFGDMIARSKLKGRRVFDLDNPLIPAMPPAARALLYRE
jgi:hypothetical protein